MGSFMFRLLVITGLATGLLASAAPAADLIIPDVPVETAVGFEWEGMYAGLQGGVQHYPNVDRTYGLVGVHAGYNFLPAESVLLGLEGSAELIWDDAAAFGEVFGSGRAGFLATDSVLLYGIAGLGIEINEAGDTFGTYHFGAGIEAAVTDAVTVRGQVVSVGFLDEADGASGVKATVGVSFHF